MSEIVNEVLHKKDLGHVSRSDELGATRKPPARKLVLLYSTSHRLLGEGHGRKARTSTV